MAGIGRSGRNPFAALAAAVLGFSALLGLGAVSLQGRLAGRPIESTPTFQLSGSVDGLFPGQATSLGVSVANPFSFDIEITSVHARVADVGGCVGSNVRIPPFSGSARVTAGREALIPLPVLLDRATPDSCQGVSFPITYTASARRAPSKVRA